MQKMLKHSGCPLELKMALFVMLLLAGRVYGTQCSASATTLSAGPITFTKDTLVKGSNQWFSFTVPVSCKTKKGTHPDITITVESATSQGVTTQISSGKYNGSYMAFFPGDLSGSSKNKGEAVIYRFAFAKSKDTPKYRALQSTQDSWQITMDSKQTNYKLYVMVTAVRMGESYVGNENMEIRSDVFLNSSASNKDTRDRINIPLSIILPKPTPECLINNTNILVQMPELDAASLPHRGDVSSSVSIPLEITCDEGSTNVFFEINGEQFAADDPYTLKVSGAQGQAQGVNIQILRAGKLFKLNTQYTLYDTSGLFQPVNLSAQYVRTGTIRPGKIEGYADFKIIYQ